MAFLKMKIRVAVNSDVFGEIGPCALSNPVYVIFQVKNWKSKEIILLKIRLYAVQVFLCGN